MVEKKTRSVTGGINNDYGWVGRRASKRFCWSLGSCVHISYNTGVTKRSCTETLTLMLNNLHQCSCRCSFCSQILLFVCTVSCLKPSTTHRCLFCSWSHTSAFHYSGLQCHILVSGLCRFIEEDVSARGHSATPSWHTILVTHSTAEIRTKVDSKTVWGVREHLAAFILIYFIEH